jgi:hypothetical protein
MTREVWVCWSMTSEKGYDRDRSFPAREAAAFRPIMSVDDGAETGDDVRSQAFLAKRDRISARTAGSVIGPGTQVHADAAADRHIEGLGFSLATGRRKRSLDSLRRPGTGRRPRCEGPAQICLFECFGEVFAVQRRCYQAKACSFSSDAISRNLKERRSQRERTEPPPTARTWARRGRRTCQTGGRRHNRTRRRPDERPHVAGSWISSRQGPCNWSIWQAFRIGLLR